MAPAQAGTTWFNRRLTQMDTDKSNCAKLACRTATRPPDDVTALESSGPFSISVHLRGSAVKNISIFAVNRPYWSRYGLGWISGGEKARMMGSHFQEISLVCLLAILGGLAYIFYLRWYVPRRERLAMERALEKAERLRREEAAGQPPNPADYHYAIAFDSQGFTVTNLRSPGQEVVAKSWSNIRLVTAFKRDLFAVDCICLRLDGTDGVGVELNEEMAGWNRLVEALPMTLPGCKPHPEWFMAVAFPAFAANPTEIYSRNPANSSPKTG